MKQIFKARILCFITLQLSTKNGETVKLAEMEEYYSYGTPEELKKYE